METNMKQIALRTSATAATPAIVAAANAATDLELQHRLDALSHEMRMGSTAAQLDEYHDYVALTKGIRPVSIEQKIADNLAFQVEHRGYTIPDAPALGKAYGDSYRETYLALRNRRNSKGGKLTNDPGQNRSTSWARGGSLTATETARRNAALETASALS
jgi:hypothetical protein